MPPQSSGPSQQKQASETFAFRSSDAVEEDCSRSAFTFCIPSRPFPKAVRLSLSSLEFPASQYSIEEGENVLYMSEGIRLEGDSDRTLSATEVFVDPSSGEVEEATSSATLPLLRNWASLSPASSPCASDRPSHSPQWPPPSVRVSTSHPHGLFATPSFCLADLLLREGVSVFLVCDSARGGGACGGGEVLLRSALLSFVSDYEFDLAFPPHPPTLSSPPLPPLPSGRAMLCTSPYPSPSSLASVLASALSARTAVPYSLSYDGAADRFLLRPARLPFGGRGGRRPASSMRFRVEEGALQARLGLSFLPQGVEASLSPSAAAGGTPSPVLPSGHTSLWSGVALTPGWYLPNARPLNAGPPRRLSVEVESRLNNFHFEEGSSLLFRDAAGALCSAPLPSGPGSVGPEDLAFRLEESMNASLSEHARRFMGASMTVRWEESRRLRFRVENRESPSAAAGLLFRMEVHSGQRPQQRASGEAGGGLADPLRLGLPARPLPSTPSLLCPFPCPSLFLSDSRVASNIYRVTEDGPTKKICIDAFPPSTFACSSTAQHCDNEDELILVLPSVLFASGLQTGDAVRVAFPPGPAAEGGGRSEGEGEGEGEGKKAAERCERKGDEEEEAEKVGPAAAAGPPSSSGQAGGGTAFPARAVVLSVRGRYVRLFLPLRVGERERQNVRVWKEREPFFFSFSEALPRCVQASGFGFRPALALPAFDAASPPLANADLCQTSSVPAPFTSCLEHPDYINVFFESQSEASSSLVHLSKPAGTHPKDASGLIAERLFTKVVFFPTVRQGGSASEMVFPSGETPSRFTLRFEAPSGRAYRLHGSPFSFNLTLLSVE